MIAEDFDHETVELVFLARSIEFLEAHVRNDPARPFLLFHSMQAVHLPSLAADRFKGRSGVGPHGDFVLEMDWIVGELLDTLDRLGLSGRTLIIFSSDNGPEVLTVLDMRETYGPDGARP